MIVQVDSRVRIPSDELGPEVLDGLKEKFTRKNPTFWKLRRIGRRAYGEEPEVKCFRLKDGEFSVGRGAYPLVCDVLEAHGVRVRVRDARCRGESFSPIPCFVDLRDYQERQREAALKIENCILRAGTGGGKTTTGLAVAAAVATATLVMVDSKDIADEWVRRCIRELRLDPGFVGNGQRRFERITIALHQSLTAQSAAKWEEVERYFGCVIADEVQICGAKTYGANVDRMPARYRIGFSDDHHRGDGKTFKVTDLFGAVADKVGDKELLSKGAIADSNIIVDPTEFRADWYADRPEDSDGDAIPPSGEEFNRLLDEMTNDDRRSASIVARIAEEVGKGKTFLVTSHRVEHCRRLLRMLEGAGVPSGLMLGGTEEFARTRDGLLSGLVKAGIGTLTALGKGVNVPDVLAGYAATPVATSQQRFRQARGRVVRAKEDGSAADYWVSWDRYVFGDAAIRKLEKWCRGKVRIAVGSERLTAAEYVAREREKNDGSQSEGLSP